MGRAERRKRRKDKDTDIDIPVARTLIIVGLFMAVVMGGVYLMGPGGGRAPVIDVFGLRVLDRINECLEPGKVRLDYFYAPSCGACERTKPGLERLKEELGNGFDLRGRCIAFRAEDQKRCRDEVGQTEYDEANRMSRGYGIRSTPTLVFSCNRVRVGFTAYEDLKRIVCGIGESIEGC